MTKAAGWGRGSSWLPQAVAQYAASQAGLQKNPPGLLALATLKAAINQFGLSNKNALITLIS